MRPIFQAGHVEKKEYDNELLPTTGVCTSPNRKPRSPSTTIVAGIAIVALVLALIFTRHRSKMIKKRSNRGMSKISILVSRIHVTNNAFLRKEKQELEQQLILSKWNAFLHDG